MSRRLIHSWGNVVRFLLAALLVSCGALSAMHAEEVTKWQYSFGPGIASEGFKQVLANITYSDERGYGFEPGAKIVDVDQSKLIENSGNAGVGSGCTSEKPFCFSAKVPEGNYRVHVIFGDWENETNTTIKSELRRLSIEQHKLPVKQFAMESFLVNVRTPAIPTAEAATKTGEVKLKDREKTSEWRLWDNRLTLEFNGEHPVVRVLEIQRVEVPVIYLLGDSTVCDQPGEPYASWGQMFTRFVKNDYAVANYAESGESMRSTRGAKRLEKVLALIKPGDYVLMQFGHNDMKAISSDDFKADLAKTCAEIQDKKAIPVLVTAMHRQSFSNGELTNSHRDYPEKVRALATEKSIALVDLHAMSEKLYVAFGPKDSSVLFKPGDKTHHSNFGAYELARCVSTALKQSTLGVKDWIVDDVPAFDPSKPDKIEDFKVPASPSRLDRTPDGS